MLTELSVCKNYEPEFFFNIVILTAAIPALVHLDYGKAVHLTIGLFN
jgi:hypothetical protein